MNIMKDEVCDHIGITGVESLEEFGYVVVKKEDGRRHATSSVALYAAPTKRLGNATQDARR